MSGVVFDRKSAERVASATKRVEAMPRSVRDVRRDTLGGAQVVFFVLNEPLGAATDSLTGADAARATVYVSDPANAPVMAADRSTYTPQDLITSSPTARVEWVVNRSLDMTGSTGAAGMAIRVNGELLVFWVDCTSGV
jgi:hypothetical protein